MNIDFTERTATVFTRFIDCNEEDWFKKLSDVKNGIYEPTRQERDEYEIYLGCKVINGWKIKSSIDLYVEDNEDEDEDEEPALAIKKLRGFIEISRNGMDYGTILRLDFFDNKVEEYYDVKIKQLVRTYTMCCECEDRFTWSSSKHCKDCYPFVMKHTEECSICMDNEHEKIWIKTRCGHVFHETCFDKLKDGKCKVPCPLCRTEVGTFDTTKI